MSLPEYLQKHLDTIAANENIVEYTLKYAAGSKHGDGFMAEMLGITMTGQKETPDGVIDIELPLICKKPPASKERQAETKTHYVFSREVLMYNKILPQLERLQREHGISEKDGFFSFPKCYLAQFDDENVGEAVIIMHDLRKLGFDLWPKERMTTVENTNLFLQHLGRLHGLSFVLRDKFPNEFAQLEAIPDVMYPIFNSSMFLDMHERSLLKAIELLEVDHAQEANALRKFHGKGLKLIHNMCDITLLGRSSVWSHGDCWINNMMFKINDDISTEIALIDWQISHIVSPAADLSNYLINCTDKNIRDEHISDFLKLYHESATQIIRAFGCDPESLYSYLDLEKQLNDFGYYGSFLSAMMIPVLIGNSAEIVDLTALTTNKDETPKHGLATLSPEAEQIYIQRLSDSVRDALAYGWLNGLEAV